MLDGQTLLASAPCRIGSRSPRWMARRSSPTGKRPGTRCTATARRRALVRRRTGGAAKLFPQQRATPVRLRGVGGELLQNARRCRAPAWSARATGLSVPAPRTVPAVGRRRVRSTARGHHRRHGRAGSAFLRCRIRPAPARRARRCGIPSARDRQFGDAGVRALYIGMAVLAVARARSPRPSSRTCAT